MLQQRLSDAWREATGGSSIVDIRAVNNATTAAGYVAKYVGKNPPLHDLEHAEELLAEYYLAVKGRKMIISFGKGKPLPELSELDPENEEHEKIVVICSLKKAIAFANNGSVFHRHVLEQLIAARAITPNCKSP